MKKTLLFLAMLASVLLACGGAPAYAEQAAPAQAYPALTDAQRAAFSGAQWEGYTLMLWRDAQATETSEAYAQAELGACAVLQKKRPKYAVPAWPGRIKVLARPGPKRLIAAAGLDV